MELVLLYEHYRTFEETLTTLLPIFVSDHHTLVDLALSLLFINGHINYSYIQNYNNNLQTKTKT